MSLYHKTAAYGFLCLLAFLGGTMISHQIHFFMVFEGALFLDWVILIGIMGMAAGVGHLYLHTKPLTVTALQMAVLCLSTIAFELSFITYGKSQVASFVPYLILFATGFVLGLSLNAIEISYKWYFIISILLIGGILYQYYQSDRFLNSYLVITGLLLLLLRNYLAIKRKHSLLLIMSVPVVVVAVIYNNTAVPDARQSRYYDKVVYSRTGSFQQIDVTEWEGNYWFYYNNVNQFSSIDEWLYAEPMVHPVMELSEYDRDVLVIGGENGIIAREILKHDVHILDIVPLDFELIAEGAGNRFFTRVNKNALTDSRVEIHHTNAFRFLHSRKDRYDVILIDVPDPLDLELNEYYTKEFYQLCYDALRTDGIMITQAGSPYFATKAFMAIEKTIIAANFATLPLHNQVLTLGEWGWVIGSKKMNRAMLRNTAKKLKFNHLDTRWINNEAMQLLISFGKPYQPIDSVAVNSLKNPVIHSYYKSGTWKF